MCLSPSPWRAPEQATRQYQRAGQNVQKSAARTAEESGYPYDPDPHEDGLPVALPGEQQVACGSQGEYESDNQIFPEASRTYEDRIWQRKHLVGQRSGFLKISEVLQLWSQVRGI